MTAPLTTLLDSPLGPIVLEASERGLTHLRFAEASERDNLRKTSDASTRESEILCLARRTLEAFFSGAAFNFDDLPLDLRVTAFQGKVLGHLRRIPSGQTSSYKTLAEAVLGQASYARATASALRANPVPIIVPCHRIIPCQGGVGGYSGQPWRKAWLLRWENNR